MTHGSGGSATQALIRDVFKRLGNPILNRMEDAAVLDMSSLAGAADTNRRLAYTTDSFVVSPVIFKGGDIGRLSVCGTVNDLLSMGATPRYLTAGFIIEEGMTFETLEKIVASMADALLESGIQLVAADTKVIEGKGGIMINTSGVGVIPEGVDVGASKIVVGDSVLVTGNLGDHHAAILSHRLGIENEIASDVAPLQTMVGRLLDASVEIHAMRDITRGGLATVLNELAEASGVAIGMNHDAIPVSEEVAAFCGILGLDPLYMGNEGKMAIIVAPECEAKALEIIRQSPYGAYAAKIGTVTQGSSVSITTLSGGRRVVPLLHGEGLPRIC